MINFRIYSPVEQVHHPAYEQQQIRVFIKRDDLIHPFISGNKWRKLKYLLSKAYSEQKTHLVTFGGVYSNHLLATACAAAQFGFKSTGIVRGERVQNDVLMLCHLFGMELIFVSRQTYLNKKALFETHFGHDPQAFFIDEGGASEQAAQGCAELIDELKHPYDHIVCACGTGTTAGGLLRGIENHHLKSVLDVVSIFKDGSLMQQEISKYCSHTPRLEMHLNYGFGGYAKTTPDLVRFIRSFISRTGIVIDPVYTGKVWYAVHDLIVQQYFPPGCTILVIHTGGLFGLFGMSSKFFPLQESKLGSRGE